MKSMVMHKHIRSAYVEMTDNDDFTPATVQDCDTSSNSPRTYVSES